MLIRLPLVGKILLPLKYNNFCSQNVHFQFSAHAVEINKSPSILPIIFWRYSSKLKRLENLLHVNVLTLYLFAKLMNSIEPRMQHFFAFRFHDFLRRKFWVPLEFTSSFISLKRQIICYQKMDGFQFYEFSWKFIEIFVNLNYNSFDGIIKVLFRYYVKELPFVMQIIFKLDFSSFWGEFEWNLSGF